MSLAPVKSLKFDINFLFKYLIVVVPITIIAGNFILNINIFLIDIIFLFLILKKKVKLKGITSLFILAFSIIVVFNIYFSSNINLSVKGSIGILKYLIFFLAFLQFLDNEENKKLFIKFIFYLILFVILDVFVQYIFGKDIFGIEYDSSHGKRLSGPFGDELVVGAYISKISFLGCLYLINIKKNNLFLASFILLFLICIFITQERSAFFITLLSATFFILFFKFKNIQKITILLSLSIMIVLLLNFDKSSYNKYLNLTPLQLGFTEDLHKRSLSTKSVGDHPINSFWDSRYGAHFLTAYNIYLDNKLIGSGIKTFRSECSLQKYNKIKSQYIDKRCNTHPHNIYLEILSEGGLFIFIPFCVVIFFLIVINLKNVLFNENYEKSMVNLCILIILFFPIQTTGSFFSTFNGIFYWLGAALIIKNLDYNLFSRSH